MAGNSRDVTLTLSVDTLGKEGVDQLKQALAALAKEGGAASPELIDAVEATLSAERVRPMTDRVTVLSASIVNYTISAQLVMYPGPAPEVVQQAALAAVTAYAEAQRRIGYDVTLSGLYAALHQPDVQSVTLTAPASSLVVADGQARFCTAITVTVAGTTDV